MIRVGQREFVIPLWLWAALPLAFMIYAGIDLSLSFQGRLLTYSEPDARYLVVLKKFAVASLAGFLLVDIARRSRTAWYALPFLLLASVAVAFVVAETVGGSLDQTTRFLVGLALMAVGSRGGTAGLGMALWAAMLAAVLLMAVAAALAVTLTDRLIAGLPLLTRDARREFWANLAGAVIWLAIAMGGYMAIRSSYGLALGHPGSAVPIWLPIAAACGAALAATAAHLALARRSRATQPEPGKIKFWPIVAVCVIAYFWRPDLFGVTAVRFYYDQLRPGLRAVHLLPTPVIAVAGYTVDVPFHDFKTQINRVQPGGVTASVSVPLPLAYGLMSGADTARVSIYRRDAAENFVAPFWPNHRKALDEAEAKAPGAGAVLHMPGRTGGVILRLAAYPDVGFHLWPTDPPTERDRAEQVLRAFIRERVKKAD